MERTLPVRGAIDASLKCLSGVCGVDAMTQSDKVIIKALEVSVLVKRSINRTLRLSCRDWKFETIKNLFGLSANK